MNPVRRLYLRLRAIVWTAFALVCIALAVLVGIANLLLPYADRYRPEVEQWLAERLGRPVTIAGIEAEWAAFGPRIYVEGLTVGAPGDPDRLEIDMANVGLDLYGLVRPSGGGLQSLRLFVEEIELLRDAGGDWRLGSLTSGGQPVRSEGNPIRWLSGQSTVGFAVSRITLRDEASGRLMRLPGGTLSFTHHDDHQHIAAELGDDERGWLRVMLERSDQDGDSAYLEARGMALASWTEGMLHDVAVRDGSLDFRVWLDLGENNEARGSLNISDLVLEATAASPVQGLYSLQGLNAQLYGWEEDGEQGLSLEQLTLRRDDQASAAGRLGVATDGQRLRFTGNNLLADQWTDALTLMPLLPVRWRAMLAAANPHGRVERMDLWLDRTSSPPAIHGNLSLLDADWQAVGHWPAASHVSSAWSFHGHEAQGTVQGRQSVIDVASLFRKPLPPMEIDGRVVVSWQTLPVRLDIIDSTLTTAGAAGVARGQVVLNEGLPFVDLALRVDGGEVTEAGYYWPIPHMSADVVAWLDGALTGGRVETGSMVLFGDLDQWPFDRQEGRFVARASVTGGRLLFDPAWPVIENIAADLEFDNQGLAAQVHGAETRGLSVGESEVDILSWDQPVLTTRIQGSGDGNAVLAYLRDTPLENDYGADTRSLQITGTTDLWINLDIPLYNGGGDNRVVGHAWLNEADVTDQKWQVQFDQTTGRVDFNQDGFEARELSTRFRDVAAQLTVRGGGFVEDPTLLAEGILSADDSARVLLAERAVLAPITPVLRPDAAWLARIAVPLSGEPRFELETSLGGDLPRPFGEPLPLRVRFDLVEPMDHLIATIGDIAALDLRTLPAGWAAHLAFGEAAATPASAPGLRVSGRLDGLDADGWLALLDRAEDLSGQTAALPMMDAVDLTIGDLALAQRHFDEVRLQTRSERDYLYLDVSSEEMLGRIRLPSRMGENRLLLAEFDHLHWPEGEGDGMDTDVDPRSYPPMDFYAAELVFEGSALGAVRFESFPTRDGMRIETFETDSPQLRISANGLWLSADRSRFNATLLSSDLGAALAQFGFSGMIEGGQLTAQLAAEWPGAPSEFELAQVDGSLELQVDRGQITEVDPGAGRIFGLLSVQSLPRRLLLDFSDLFKSGLTFDRISGTFTLEDGHATTRNLAILGPTADVYIQGRTGLATRDYDQLVTVVPKVGETLPLVGAIAGGGVGAAALLLLQNVFSNQIERITRYHYVVTGPWSEPEIELMGANETPLDIEAVRAERDGAGG